MADHDTEAHLSELVAKSIAPPFDKLSMPPAERERLQALYKQDPKQVLTLGHRTFTTDDYAALATFPGKVIVLLEVDWILDAGATRLAAWPGDTLFLGTAVLTPSTAKLLATWKGTSLHLDNLDDVDAETVAALATWHGQTLGLAHAKLAPDAVEKLAAFKGAVAISLDHEKVPPAGAPAAAISEQDLATLGRISKAIDNGEVDTVREFLKGGGAVDMNERGTTLLMEATNMKQLAVAKLLVEAHANVNAVNASGLTPLYYALDDLAQVPSNTPATVSALVHLLVEAGADLSTTGKGEMWTPPLSQAAKRGDKDLITYLMSKGPKGAGVDPGALIEAIDHGDPATIKQLLAAGADINPASPGMGMIPIHQAISQGAIAIEMARYEKKDASALVTQWVAVVDVVIGAGAKLSTRDDRGRTSLEVAINGGAIEILTRVLDAKPKLDELDGDGKTPLQYLAGNARLDEPALVPLAKLLRARGAAGDAKAAEIATTRKFATLASVLR